MSQLKCALLADKVEVFADINIPDIATAKLQLSSNREHTDDGLYLCDLGEVVLKHNSWIEVFPDIQAYYAVRCNPDEILLKWLAAMGVRFNCANKIEMKRVLDIGASADKIVLGNPCKIPSDIRFAAENGIKLVSFDSKDELKKMKKIYPDAELLLCIGVDEDSSASNKYGASTKQAQQLISFAVELQLNVVGISFNNGNEMDNNVDVYIKAFQRARSLFDFCKSIGVPLSVLDICGDFPAANNNKQAFHKVAKVIKEEIEKQFPSSQFGGLRVIGEAGTFYAESAIIACTNIIAKKADLIEVDNVEGGETKSNCQTGFKYYLGEGMYGCFNKLFASTKQKQFNTPIPLKKFDDQSQQHPTAIWGPTCDGMDDVCALTYLPELEVGDWLIWKDMGAYSSVGSCSFNGYRTVCVHYFISEKHWRKIENSITIDDD